MECCLYTVWYAMWLYIVIVWLYHAMYFTAKATVLFLENRTQRALARQGVRIVLGFAGATSEYEVVEPKVACPPTLSTHTFPQR